MTIKPITKTFAANLSGTEFRNLTEVEQYSAIESHLITTIADHGGSVPDLTREDCILIIEDLSYWVNPKLIDRFCSDFGL